MSLRRTLSRLWQSEDGAVLVLFAFSLPLFMLLFAFTIDLGLLRMTGNRLQIAADAAALAGAQELGGGDVQTLARQYAASNYPDPAGGPVLLNADIVTGHWTGTSFVPAGTPTDAVRVITRRDAVNSNPLGALFATFAGIGAYEVTRSAVAHVGHNELCKSGGFFSNANVESGSDNAYLSDFCLYGKDGVKISSDNSFAEGAFIGMNDLDDFEQGGNNTGVGDALAEMDQPLLLPNMVPGIIAQMESSTAGLPGFTSWTLVEIDEITDSTPLVEGTLYVVDEVADLGSDRTVQNIAIVAGKEVKLGSNNTISNVVFASPDKILIGSNNLIGGATPCAGGEFNTYLFSESNIEFGSNNSIGATQMSAGDQLKLGSDIAAMTNVYAEASGLIDYGSAESMGACPGGLGSHYAQITITAGDGNLALVQ